MNKEILKTLGASFFLTTAIFGAGVSIAPHLAAEEAGSSKNGGYLLAQPTMETPETLEPTTPIDPTTPTDPTTPVEPTPIDPTTPGTLSTPEPTPIEPTTPETTIESTPVEPTPVEPTPLSDDDDQSAPSPRALW